MDISTLEDFLTYSINLVIMIIIVLITFDFILFLIDSWKQVSSSQPNFYASCSSTESEGAVCGTCFRTLNAPSKTALAYQQVKDALWDKSDLLTS